MKECEHEYQIIDDLPGPTFAICILCGKVRPEEDTLSSNKTVYLEYDNPHD